jgi:hypothetical protein
MNPYRAPYEVARGDDDPMARLARADWAFAHLRDVRRLLTTAVALTSIFPWLRAFAFSWAVPRALVDVGVALWSTLGIGAIVVWLQEREHARERASCLRELARLMHDR